MKRKFIWLFFAVVAMFATINLSLAGDWPTYQGNYQRTGFTTDSLNQQDLTLAWSVRLEAGSRATASHPVIWQDTVYAVFGGGVIATRKLAALDINTGAFYWSALLPGASGSTPAVEVVDTTGFGDSATLIYVGNGNNSVSCYRSDGIVKWTTATTLGHNIAGSQPVLADSTTPKDGNPDLVLVGSSRFGSAWCFNALTGAIVWSVNLDTASTTFQNLNGPALSEDDSIAYFTTVDFGTYEGHVRAVSTRTGAVLGNFVRAGSGFVANATVLPGGDVLVVGFNDLATTNFARRVYLLDRLCAQISRTPYDNGNQRGGGAIYPDPISGDTIYWAVSEDFNLVIGWSLAAMRAANNNPASLYSLFGTCAPAPGPTSISGSGVGVVNTQGNQLLGLPPGPNEMYVFDAASGAIYWNKPYGYSDATGSFNRSGVAIANASDNDSGIVLVTMEGAGYIHGLKHSGPRARFELEPVVSVGDPCPELLFNIPFPFNGTMTDSALFTNVGDAAGSYTGASTDSVLVAAGKGVSNVTVEYLKAKPARERLALALTDELSITKKGKFFEKNMADLYEMVPSDESDALLENSSYLTKKDFGWAVSASIPPAWLTINDLTGGGPIAPGSDAIIEATASSASLGLGEYFAEIHLDGVTPSDPDPDFDSSNHGLVYPVHLIVGFIPEEVVITTPLVEKLVTNYSALANATGTQNFVYNSVNELYDGTIILANSDSTLVMDVFDHDTLGVLPDSSIRVDTLTDSTLSYTRYVDKAGLGVKVEQYTRTFNDPERAGFVLYRLVITNISDSLIPSLGVGLYFDWDIDVNTYGTNLGGMDTAYKVFYQYDDANPALRFGVMGIPYTSPVYGYELLDNNVYVYSPADIADSIWAIMTRASFSSTGAGGPDDHSMLLTLSLADLDSGATRVEEFALFGYDTTLITTDSLANLINATATSVREIISQTTKLPKSFELNQNFPNPFNAITQIRFAVPKQSYVKLDIYDILGRKVKSLVNEDLTAGHKQITWNGKNESGDEVASGVYFYRIKTEDFQTTKKMVLLK